MKHPRLAKVLAILEVIIRDPVFRTGSDSWDWWFTLGLYLALLSSFIVVVSVYIRQYRLHRHRIDDQKWTWIKFFLLISLISLLVTNILRYKHREIKLASLATLHTSRKIKEMFKSCELKDYLPDNVDIKYKGYKWFYGKLPDTLVERTPWLPIDWSRNASVWDYFKLLIDTGRRNWWTQQWVMGYLAWAMFVTVECDTRGLSKLVATSFIILGCSFSLAAVQSAFYALLLLVPRPAQTRHRPSEKMIAILAFLQVAVYNGLPWALARIEASDTSTKPFWEALFSILQALILVSCVLIPALCSISKATRTTGTPDDRDRARVTAYSWSAASLASILLHLHASYNAFVEANPARFSSWAQLTYLSPWRHESNSLKETAVHILGTLGDHPWVNALGWDVLLSLVGLCAWSVASGADARCMLQCSIAPWLDDFVEAAEQVAEVVHEKADRDYSSGVSGKARKDRCAPRSQSPKAGSMAASSNNGKDDEGPAEQAGLAWCLYVVGGLGAASAAVYGADTLPC